jgi:hypothetical protein
VANAGGTFVISVPRATGFVGRALGLTGDLEASRQRILALLGFDLFDLSTLSAFKPDPERRIVMAWGIVDPEQLRARLAAPAAPKQGEHFAIRFRLTLPVTEPAAAAAALEKVKLGAECARPRRGETAGAWATWLKGVTDPDDRRAAETSEAAYVCLNGSEAAVARVDAAHREVRWSFALGTGGRLAAAAAPYAPDAAETERLTREGFFKARGAFRATPDAEARYRAGMLLFKLAAGFQGLDAESARRMWPRAVEELGSFMRLVESPPRLFSEIVLIDGATTWGLTPEGEQAFAGLKVKWPATPDDVFTRVGGVVRPAGVFATAAVLDENLHQAEPQQAAADLLTHHLWPHLAAFVAAHPKDRAPPVELPFPGSRFELDRAGRRLRLLPP